MKRYLHHTALFGLITVTLLLNACAEFQRGDQPSDAPTTTYSFGTLKASEVVPFDRAMEPVRRALADLHFSLKSIEKDPLRIEMVVTGEGKDIHITLEETTTTSTEIRIRAGKLGDKVLSKRLLHAIEKHF